MKRWVTLALILILAGGLVFYAIRMTDLQAQLNRLQSDYQSLQSQYTELGSIYKSPKSDYESLRSEYALLPPKIEIFDLPGSDYKDIIYNSYNDRIYISDPSDYSFYEVDRSGNSIKIEIPLYSPDEYYLPEFFHVDNDGNVWITLGFRTSDWRTFTRVYNRFYKYNISNRIGQVIDTGGTPEASYQGFFPWDGYVFAAGGDRKNIHKLDKDGNFIQSYSVGGAAESVTVRENLHLLYTNVGEGRWLSIIDLDTGEETRQVFALDYLIGGANKVNIFPINVSELLRVGLGGGWKRGAFAYGVHLADDKKTVLGVQYLGNNAQMYAHLPPGYFISGNNLVNYFSWQSFPLPFPHPDYSSIRICFYEDEIFAVESVSKKLAIIPFRNVPMVPYRFEQGIVPLVRDDSLAAGATSKDRDGIPLEPGRATRLALTVEGTYDEAAAQGIKVHVRSSYDGTNYDTKDWDTWTPTFTAGGTIRETRSYTTEPMFIKVYVENLDGAEAVTDIRVTAVLGD